MNYDANDISCAHEIEGAQKIPAEDERLLFKAETVKGRALGNRYADTIFSNLSTTRLYLITVVHVVGIPSPTGGFMPIVSDDWIETMFQRANDIWSQACIELVPYFTGTLVTEFRDIGLSAFAGLCLSPQQLGLVEPYDIKAPDTIIVNVYLVEDTNGIACGSPISGRVFLPTSAQIPEKVGRVFAHELGHVMLNPVGVNDSDNPDHLMFHVSTHPDIPPGSKEGLFLSDCVGARTTAQENLFAFARPGGLGSPNDPVACEMSPRLGNNLVVVATKFARD